MVKRRTPYTNNGRPDSVIRSLDLGRSENSADPIGKSASFPLGGGETRRHDPKARAAPVEMNKVCRRLVRHAAVLLDMDGRNPTWQIGMGIFIDDRIRQLYRSVVTHV